MTLENVWIAYQKVSKWYPKGLITYNGYDLKLDSLFFYDLLYHATKNTNKQFMNRFKMTDLKDNSYKDYIQGLYWCFGMYVTGNCSDYTYIYHHDASPHVTGIALVMLHNTSYHITKSPSVDVDLYGILLMPEKAKCLLSKEQNLIAEKLVEKYPIIYEEGRCKKCKEFSTSVANLNKQYKLFDSESDEKMDIAKKLAKLNQNFAVHREIHDKLNSQNRRNI